MKVEARNSEKSSFQIINEVAIMDKQLFLLVLSESTSRIEVIVESDLSYEGVDGP